MLSGHSIRRPADDTAENPVDLQDNAGRLGSVWGGRASAGVCLLHAEAHAEAHAAVLTKAAGRFPGSVTGSVLMPPSVGTVRGIRSRKPSMSGRISDELVQERSMENRQVNAVAGTRDQDVAGERAVIQ